MTIESSIAQHVRTGDFYRVDVFAYPVKWQETPLGRLKLRMAYRLPKGLVKRVSSEALLSLDRSEAQERLPTILAARRFDGDIAYFGKVVKDPVLK